MIKLILSWIKKKHKLLLAHLSYKPLLCSNCFKNEGLKLTAIKIGMTNHKTCSNCKSKNGKKLCKEELNDLTYLFFVRGTLKRFDFGGAPIIQYNEYHTNKTNVNFCQSVNEDTKLIEKNLGVGFFYYGPRLWMCGENEPLLSLQNSAVECEIVINNILQTYPTRILTKNSYFYRLRRNPKNPASHDEYDSPPTPQEAGRLDSTNLSIMYASQVLDVCIQECRTTFEDALFVATLQTCRDLRLLDLGALISDNKNEFESIDTAINMLFLAKEHSYFISRKIAYAAYKNGYDGIIFPSYFSELLTGTIPFETTLGISMRRIPHFKKFISESTIPNIALFGHPIKNNIVKIKDINKLILNKIIYSISFGPILESK